MNGENSSSDLYEVEFRSAPCPQTLGDAVASYRDSVQNHAVCSKADTAIRIWVAGAGGPRRRGKRATDIEKRQITEFIQAFKFGRFWQGDPVETLERGFRRLKINPRSQSTYRNSFKLILAAWHTQGWDPRAPIEPIYLPICAPNGKSRPQARRKKWKKASKICLSPTESPDRLNQEFSAFKSFCLQVIGIRKRSYDEGWLRRYLGMRCREGIPMAEISFYHLIPYIKPAERLGFYDLIQDPIWQNHPTTKTALEAGNQFTALALAKEVRREEERQGIKAVERLFRQFAAYTHAQSIGRLVELDWLIRLTKYLYDEDIQEVGEEGISILKCLKRLRKQLRKKAEEEASRLPYGEVSLGREALLSLIVRLKHLATQEKGINGKRPLALSTRARHMQQFLLIALLGLIPPRRRRVLVELEVGRTLRRGLRIDRRFIPVEELPDSSQARWYFTLNPEDYKTGKVNGVDWTPIENWTFEDGTTLYDYIDRWLQDLRPQLNPQHQGFFIQTGHGRSVAGARVTAEIFYRWCRHATERHAGVSVAPKTFRKMYVSLIKSLPHITEADLEAVAAAMGHSRQMQEQVYNQLGHDETVAPVLDIQKRINQDYLENGGRASTR
jgi:hypothetical protein